MKTQKHGLLARLSKAPRRACPGAVIETIRRRVRFAWHRLAMEGWHEFLQSRPFFSQLASEVPGLINKVHAPYFSRAFNVARRISVLIEHYSYVHRLGWGPVVLEAAKRPVALASFEGQTGQTYALKLRAAAIMEPHGDLILQLWREDRLVCSCAFSFIVTHGFALGIGGFEEPPYGVHLGDAIETVYDLHGVDPRALLVHVLASVARRLGCQSLHLVSGHNHVGDRMRTDRIGVADSLWLKCGARRRADGDFELDCAGSPPTHQVAEYPLDSIFQAAAWDQLQKAAGTEPEPLRSRCAPAGIDQEHD